MRIATHSALAYTPTPTVTVRPSSPVKSTPGVRKLSPTAAQVQSGNPFGGLLQSLKTSRPASPASPAVSLASLFGPSAMLARPPVAAAVAPAAVKTSAAPVAAGAATPIAAATLPAPSTVTLNPPGLQALVGAILNGSFQPTYVTDPSQLQEINPAGTATMPNFYYASDATAQQLASLLGGTVVQRTAFGQDQGWTEPMANFVQLPNGQTFNAADIAYYARCGNVGASQLTADLTQAINQGAAWSNYYTNGGPLPIFTPGYVGPPISGMTYPVGSIGSDGNVINPSMHG